MTTAEYSRLLPTSDGDSCFDEVSIPFELKNFVLLLNRSAFRRSAKPHSAGSFIFLLGGTARCIRRRFGCGFSCFREGCNLRPRTATRERSIREAHCCLKIL